MVTETVSADLLGRCAPLSDLTRDARAKLASIAEERMVPRGTTVFDDMDPANRFYLLIKGEISLYCELGSGEKRVMDTVNDGELFAWSALVEPYRYTATATATRDCELIAFDAAKLRTMCREDVGLGYQMFNKIAEVLSNRLESARVQLAAS
ncbi:MAG: Crp/Fnr family transcriptional regulator [Planctomycetota bacterium]